jgi:type I restriction enzyme S subunit
MPRADMNEVLEFYFPLPPLPEQQRIVGILDEAFDGIATAKANAEKNLLNARALFESHLQSVFTQRGEGREEQKLGELATFRNGINFTKSSRGDTVKIVGVKDFQNNFWAPLDSLDAATIDGAPADSDTLKENDLLFVRSNGSMELIGRCLLVGAVAERITHSGFTIRARLNGNGLSAKYLCHFLKSNNARREMIDSGIGTNIKSLNQATLSALVVPIPSTAEQARIVGQLESLNVETQRLKSLYQRKHAALDALKKSLLHQAFSGHL